MTFFRRRPFFVLAPVLVLVMVLLGTAGCSDSSSSELKTYTNGDYQYSFQYPASWEVLETGSADVSAGGEAAASVGVYDPKGAVADDTFIDMVQVSVYELQVTVDEATMPEIKTEVENVLASLESQAGDLKTVEPLAETSVGDMDGYQVTYSFVKSGAPVTSTLYFLFSGDTEYQLTVQAADANWEKNQPVYEALLSSFTPGATE